jgi:CO/xanthine dehydrogenase FAD-binding subunit
MPLPRQIHRPATPTEAAALLQQPGAVPLELGPRVPPDVHANAESVVDLSRLGLDYIRADEDAIRIGPLTPLQSLVESEVIRAHASGLLARAARIVAHLGLRHIATLGAAWRATDGPPDVRLALLVLDAATNTDSPLAELILPRRPGVRAALERIARTPRDEAIVAAAVSLILREGVCREVRVALAGACPQPRRFIEVEAVLEGQAPTANILQRAAEAAVANADPVADYRGSAEYRRAMAGVLVRRAVEMALALSN